MEIKDIKSTFKGKYLVCANVDENKTRNRYDLSYLFKVNDVEFDGEMYSLSAELDMYTRYMLSPKVVEQLYHNGTAKVSNYTTPQPSWLKDYTLFKLLDESPVSYVK